MLSAVHVKWQRKLGTPKVGESFLELFDRPGCWSSMKNSMMNLLPLVVIHKVRVINPYGHRKEMVATDRSLWKYCREGSKGDGTT